MHSGSRHRPPEHGRGGHERPQESGPATAVTTRSRGSSRAAKVIGATVAVSLTAGVVAVVAASASDSGTAPTAMTVPAAQDTYVYQEYPTVNRGSSDKLTASNKATLHTRSYLRFSVKGVPAGVPGLKAHLQFSSDRNQPSQVDLHRVSSTTWTQMTMTMNNAPAVGATVAVAKPAARQKTLDFDLSGVVTGDGEYSFALIAPLAETVSAVFSSEHGTDGPRLVLDWSGAAPAPTTPAPATSSPGLPGLPSLSPVKPSPSGTTPSASPTAPAPTTNPAPSGSTLFGTTVWPSGGLTYAQALAKADTTYGRMDMVRVFYPGLPAAWPGAAGMSGRPVVVSFKALPLDVLSGKLDGQLSTWFATAPKDRPIIWSYYHEPEDNIAAGSFTAADYRAAWQHLSALSKKANNPQLKSALILMGWSLTAQSGRNWKDYYPGSASIDILGWDTYNLTASKGQYSDGATVMGQVAATSRAAGKPWGVAELGSLLVSGDSGTGRAAWLQQMGSYAKANGAMFVAYFDSPVGGEYRLLDSASQLAWRKVVAS